MNFDSYQIEGFYDEYFSKNNHPRKNAKIIVKKINNIETGELQKKQKAAEKAFLNLGVTFNVYGENEAEEKIFPFDIIPRIIDNEEWTYIEKGLKQRITALNLFINDIYTDKKILKDKIIPEELVLSCEAYNKIYEEILPPHKIWCHITGTDLVRDKDGQIYVLEDNLRCPSGISYVYENRQMTKRTFPQIFETLKVRPVEDYPVRLFEMLNFMAAGKTNSPVICVLTPGIYNSAYFEHSFLARQMGVELVEGSDLLVKNDIVYMKTTKGLQKVDVIYRRIDDSYLDPLVFNKESMLGIPGIINAYKKGNIALVNAPGTGIADDKAIYSFVPEIIKYYLGEEAIIPNVPTYLCYKEKDLKYVLDNLKDMVVKTVDGAGGYGMLIGPKSTTEEIKDFSRKIKANPRKYIAQPVINLSRVPVMAENKFEGRHVDLRPYILYGKDIFVLPGGLTRVALKKGSLVVNSSQGGGSKDTWVIA